MGARKPDYRPDRTSSNARPFDSANARFICSSWKYRGRVTRSVLTGTRVRSTSSNVPKRCMFLVSGSKRGQTGVSRRSADPVRTAVTYRAAKVKFGQLQPRLDHLRLAPACTPTALVNFVQTLELRRRYALQAERHSHSEIQRSRVEMNEGPRRMVMSAESDPPPSGKSAQRQQHAGPSEPATGD